ncbi:3-isopropylmalate dehydratase small subunit [archaeon D22]|nr:3-isopropylmalate dehydratase small subunit [archaeon D22]
MSSKILKVEGKGIPKIMDDQNTDDIIPGRFLKEITFKKMGEYVYYDERFKDGEKIKDHPFNKFEGGSILIAGKNYGCGSSREHAPQALYRYGVRAVVAESFAEIFAGNCAGIGIVTIKLSHDDITKLSEYVVNNPENELVLDLEKQSVIYGDNIVKGEMIEARRKAFIDGTWDAFSVLMEEDTKQMYAKLKQEHIVK